MSVDLPVAGETPWDAKLNAAILDIDSRASAGSMGAPFWPVALKSPPPGGTTGQVLKKLSGTDYDWGWVT